MNKHSKNLQALLPKDVCHVYRDTIHDAAVELETLSADASRYQWLRSRDLDSIEKGGVFAGQTPQNIVLNGEDLDRAIDLSMAGESTQP